MNKPELLAPVGNWEMLSTAVDAGADSIYFGIVGLNMRARANNFSVEEIGDVVKYCHQNKVKAYLCINTIIFQDELNKVETILKSAKKNNIDAIICWDLAVVSLAEKFGLEIHLSTQASCSNSHSLNIHEKLGVNRVVLARECTLDDIKEIRKKTNVKIETFIHGAMCVAVSGRCFLSEHLYGKSANRGQCIQPCRRGYLITDSETGKELELDNEFVMSPKDLCTIEIIDKLIDVGIDCFKIEGRNRSPEYVKITVESYKEAIDLHFKNKLTKKKKIELKNKLSEVYNRGFSKGFYLGRPIDEWTDSYGSKSTMVKEHIGVVENYFEKVSVAEIKVESGNLQQGEDILVIGPTTGCIETKVGSMEIENKKVKNVFKGQSVGIMISNKVRKNDKVYRWVIRKNS